MQITTVEHKIAIIMVLPSFQPIIFPTSSDFSGLCVPYGQTPPGRTRSALGGMHRGAHKDQVLVDCVPSFLAGVKTLGGTGAVGLRRLASPSLISGNVIWML
jgi:hypothetical protein